MLEFLSMTFLGTTVYMLGILTIFFISLIVADVNDSPGSIVLATVIFLVVNYQWGSLNLMPYISVRSVGSYFLVGVLYSFIRTWLLGKRLTEEEKKYLSLSGRVFRWIFYWPISLVTWTFGSLLSDAWKFFYNKMEKVYLALLNGKF